MPGYEPKRPRPTPPSVDSEAQVDALLESPDPAESTKPPSSNPFAEDSGDTHTETAEADAPQSTVDVSTAGIPAESPFSDSPRRVRPLPPEPDGHGPGPVVPMTVLAVLGLLVLMYLWRRRRNR